MLKNGAKKWVGRALMAIFAVVAGVGILKATPYLLAQAKLALPRGEVQADARNLVGPFVDAARSVQEKVDQLKATEVENERLKAENAHLRLALEEQGFECHSKESTGLTRELERKLSKGTGDRVGRSLASISYRPPTHLSSAQLYTLGVSYFRAREDEKAAVILTFLTGLEDNKTFKNPRDLLMTGVAWYRLDNPVLADRYFDDALKAPANQQSGDAQQSKAQARLWRALVAERLGHHAKAQFWLRELVDHNPRATETRWINAPREAERATASQDD